jgi:hypothetical protein
MVDTNAVIVDLLKEAAAAHAVHEAEELGGVWDEEWPEWYAAHMTRALTSRGYRLIREPGGSATAGGTDDD